jgi:hypothetical protein
MFKLQNKMLYDELNLLRHQQCDFNKQYDIKDENNENAQLTSDDTHKHKDELDVTQTVFYLSSTHTNLACNLHYTIS